MKVTAVLLAADKTYAHEVRFSKVPSLVRQAYVVACVGSVEIRHNGKARCHCRSWRGEVKNYVGASAECVLQEPQLGTGHATMQAEIAAQRQNRLCHCDVCGYAHSGETFRRLVETQRHNPGPFSMLTVIAEDPHGFGRIVRNADGTVGAIVEDTFATPEQYEIKELNVGAYCFNADWLWEALHRIQKNPKKGEYYLTDIVEIAVKDNLPVQAVVHDDFIETIGINVHLSEAEAALRLRINREHMLNGVSMMDTVSTYMNVDVKIGKDTMIITKHLPPWNYDHR